MRGGGRGCGRGGGRGGTAARQVTEEKRPRAGGVMWDCRPGLVVALVVRVDLLREREVGCGPEIYIG